MTTPRKRVLSGMQPSGLLHLGNYLGALENWKGLQNEFECYFFVADWHALSTNYADTSRVREFVHELLLDWLAAGIDPAKATVFVQSRIPEHAVLHLLLSMMTPVSWLERNPTYKEKREELKDRDLSTYGFLGYPVLQAADILIYKPDFVPVGKDQLPHLELTSGYARKRIVLQANTATHGTLPLHLEGSARGCSNIAVSRKYCSRVPTSASALAGRIVCPFFSMCRRPAPGPSRSFDLAN